MNPVAEQSKDAEIKHVVAEQVPPDVGWRHTSVANGFEVAKAAPNASAKANTEKITLTFFIKLKFSYDLLSFRFSVFPCLLISNVLAVL